MASRKRKGEATTVEEVKRPSGPPHKQHKTEAKQDSKSGKEEKESKPAQEKAKAQLFTGVPKGLKRILNVRALMQILDNPVCHSALRRIIEAHAQDVLENSLTKEAERFASLLATRINTDMSVQGFADWSPDTGTTISSFYRYRLGLQTEQAENHTINGDAWVEKIIMKNYTQPAQVKQWFLNLYKQHPARLFRILKRYNQELPKPVPPTGSLPPLPRPAMSQLWWPAIMPYLTSGEILSKVGQLSRAWLDHVWLHLPYRRRDVNLKEYRGNHGKGTDALKRMFDIYQCAFGRSKKWPLIISSLRLNIRLATYHNCMKGTDAGMVVKLLQVSRHITVSSSTLELFNTALSIYHWNPTINPNKKAFDQFIFGNMKSLTTVTIPSLKSAKKRKYDSSGGFFFALVQIPWELCPALTTVHVDCGAFLPHSFKMPNVSHRNATRRIPRCVLSMPLREWNVPVLAKCQEIIFRLVLLGLFEAIHFVFLTDNEKELIQKIKWYPPEKLATWQEGKYGARVLYHLVPSSWNTLSNDRRFDDLDSTPGTCIRMDTSKEETGIPLSLEWSSTKS